MIHFHADPPLQIAGQKLSVVSQIQISGNNCGDTVFVSGSKRPAAVVFHSAEGDNYLSIADDQIDELALRKFLTSLQAQKTYK
jgi:hypothetical protein